MLVESTSADEGAIVPAGDNSVDQIGGAQANVSSSSPRTEKTADVGLSSFQVALIERALISYSELVPSYELDSRLLASAFHECRRAELKFGEGKFDEGIY